MASDVNELASKQGWRKAGFGPQSLSDHIWLIDLNKIDIQAYDRVVIFYWAPWSGPAAGSWEMLISRLSQCKIKPEILLIDADTHNSNPGSGIFMQLFGKIVGAWGETCWIRAGSIIGQDYFGAHDKLKIEISPAELLETRIKEMGLNAEPGYSVVIQ